MNDVFLYAGNTEGTGTYTEFNIDDGQGALTDATSGDPGNANRIRGIGKANVSLGNFETSNRVPLDPIDADAVEVSRGPNASIFGLANARHGERLGRRPRNRHRPCCCAWKLRGHREGPRYQPRLWGKAAVP